jgi:hypothetical protein
LGQGETQRAYEQSVKTSATYTTQILTVSTTEIHYVTRTTVLTVVIPKPPELVVKYGWTRWYYPATGLLAKAEIKGNITNRSDLILWDVGVQFELGEGDKSEVFHHLISMIRTGEMLDLRFDYTPKGEYKYQWTWLRYRGIDQYKAAVSTTTVLQSSTIIESSRIVKTATLTTVHTILSTYTEPAVLMPEGSLLMMMAVVAIAAVAIVVVIVLRSKAAKKASAPTMATQPETAIQQAPVAEPTQAGKVCPKCQIANESEAKFCVNCGYRF